MLMLCILLTYCPKSLMHQTVRTIWQTNLTHSDRVVAFKDKWAFTVGYENTWQWFETIIKDHFITPVNAQEQPECTKSPDKKLFHGLTKLFSTLTASLTHLPHHI